MTDEKPSYTIRGRLLLEIHFPDKVRHVSWTISPSLSDGDFKKIEDVVELESRKHYFLTRTPAAWMERLKNVRPYPLRVYAGNCIWFELSDFWHADERREAGIKFGEYWRGRWKPEYADRCDKKKLSKVLKDMGHPSPDRAIEKISTDSGDILCKGFKNTKVKMEIPK